MTGARTVRPGRCRPGPSAAGSPLAPTVTTTSNGSPASPSRIDRKISGFLLNSVPIVTYTSGREGSGSSQVGLHRVGRVVEADRPELLDPRQVRDLGSLDAGRADVEVELATQAADARVRHAETIGHGRQRIDRQAPDLERPKDAERVLDVGDPGELCGDPARQLGRVVDQEVGPPVGDDPAEVLEHRIDADASEQARDEVSDLVLRRDVAPVRLGPVEARHAPPACRARPGTPRTRRAGRGRRTPDRSRTPPHARTPGRPARAAPSG